ncbi:OR1A1 protein, partial [Crocuta crocuta]
MRGDNQSFTLGFILLGLTGQQQQEDFFFILFLFIYPITVTGNLLIILAIHSDIRLHNPMYFFLANLSFVDILFSSVTIPKMLANHLLHSKAISFGGCLTQMYFMIDMANTDSYILAAMAYDRAVAISHPLHYTTIMSPRTCVLLVVGSWVVGNANALPHTLLTASLSFSMKEDNQSSILEFILLGVTGQQQQEDFFFILFLFIYPITLTGNLLIILAIHSDIRLHIPMYFFLANLSFVDILFSSVTIPKMLVNHLLHSKAISFGGCLAQLYFMIALGNTDSYILAAMAYDRAVAISRPLHYITIISPRTCVLLVVVSWVVGNANALPHTLLTSGLSFCGNKAVANFYCDTIPLLKLSCSDIRFNVKVMYLGAGVFSAPLLIIIISYVRVFSTVLRVPSTKGLLRAFSTCGSHLT